MLSKNLNATPGKAKAKAPGTKNIEDFFVKKCKQRKQCHRKDKKLK